jgi:DNA repair exonuclease SbcCD ATPase subunit
VEDAYIRAMERQETLFQKKQEEILSKGINNMRLEEENEKIRREVAKLQSSLHDSDSKNTTCTAQIEQLNAHIDDLKSEHGRMLDIQNQILEENSALHAAVQTANQELERCGYVSRDLEHANNVLRDENQTLQDRIEALLQTVSSQREELRGSFKASEQASQNLSAERREWQTTISTLQQENEDLRRRLAWLEKLQKQRPSTNLSDTGVRGPSWTELRMAAAEGKAKGT